MTTTRSNLAAARPVGRAAFVPPSPLPADGRASQPFHRRGHGRFPGATEAAGTKQKTAIRRFSAN
nr:MAG TPA: hypothetical protein [Caudoviricetes sp.]